MLSFIKLLICEEIGRGVLFLADGNNFLQPNIADTKPSIEHNRSNLVHSKGEISGRYVNYGLLCPRKVFTSNIRCDDDAIEDGSIGTEI